MKKAILKCEMFPGMFSCERFVEFETAYGKREELVCEEVCRSGGIEVDVLSGEEEPCLVEFASQLGMCLVRHMVPRDSLEDVKLQSHPPEEKYNVVC